MQATQPHRLVEPDDMTPQQVRLEPVPGNRRVGRLAPGGTQLAVTWAVATASPWGTARRLRDLVPAADGRRPASLPAAWQTALRQQPQPSGWTVSSDGAWVRAADPPRGTRLFAVSPEGRLLDPAPSAVAAAAAAAAAVAVWRDCCVVASPLVKGRAAGAKEPLPQLRPYDPPTPPPAAGAEETPPRRDLYLVGPWDDAPLDPSLWGHAGEPVTHFTVKAATLRLKQFDAANKQHSQYSPTTAMAPALWGAGATDAPDPQAVDSLAARQELAFQHRLRGASTPTARHASDGQLARFYRQLWMNASPPRLLPLQRAAQRLAAGPQGTPAADDSTDPLQPWDDPPLAWRRAWNSAQAKPRPRPHRVFMWQLLHAALPCGAASAQFLPPDREGLADVACCGNAACREGPGPTRSARGNWPLESLAHALLHCPAVQPAVKWLTELWTQVEGGPGPPATTAVWLQGDTTVWKPQHHHTALWTTLRTALLATTWALRQRRTATGEQFTPREVVGGCVEDVRRLVHADWQRVVSEITVMDGTHRSWFPGKDPRLTVIEFETFWCPGSVIAHVSHPQGASVPTLDVRLKAPD